MTMHDLPNGTLVKYRNHLYFVSEGLEARIVTSEEGDWFFLGDLNWKAFKVLYKPLTKKE
jgi:hypothetical protein